ncbi:MAG: adenylate/guanylate cyclase domain-containing protein [Flavisolibacter sp.]|nr:adenylate/guanylate cyclase domain-containing protein [Flavisolibacter sp.]
MPPKLLYYRLRILGAVSLIWLLFSIVFYYNLFPGNDLGVHVSLFQFTLIFYIIGLSITAILIFYLKPAFHHQPVWLSVLVKLMITLVLFVFIAFILLLIYFVFLYHGNFNHFLHSFFTKIVRTETFNIFMVDMGVMTLISIILLEVIDKYGPGLFWSLLVGEYHRPVVQNRIFIFLDMNASTSIAEQLGHEKYFRMLNDFFHVITLSVLANDGDIYQYVGDELVVTWPNTLENKIKSLKFIRNAFYLVQRRSKYYQKRYGVLPEFKAGVHAGEVTAGLIGMIKRDLIYCGDTVNTTARIRSMCGELNEFFILSEDFMHDFSPPFGYEIVVIGKLELKGRNEPAKLYSLKFE